ncbi:MAG: ribosomal protein S18-alanine N-acetyltransferase [Lachnospiraceae bacterium]|nr:ribosomal protein S18-alanine N-acetyltransferase [Lachnospiraceae bacterium]
MAELERECFSDPWSEDSITEMYGTKILVGVEEAGTDEGIGVEPTERTVRGIVGYAVIRTVADEAELLRICVSKSARRNGFGRMLLSESLKTAKEDGAERVFLEVRSQNLPARSLYEKAGFEETGVRKNYYHDPTDDAVIMMRDDMQL